MASIAGFFGKFFGNTIGEAAGYGIGSALQKPLEPPLQELTNETWRAATAAGAYVPLDPGDAAEIVAEDVELQAWGADQAAQTGVGSAQFAALVQAVLNAPGVPEALILLRRNQISPDDFAHALRKARLEKRWDDALLSLQDAYLDPAVIALGIVRDTIPDPGLQVGAHDTTGSDIPQGEQYPRDVMAEFKAGGIDEARARVMVQNIGLPMPPVRAANAYFRHIINKASYYLSVAQSDSRPAWADAILEEARQILTAHDWVELRLRGWIGDDAMYAGTALHGMSKADTDNMFLVLGRPLVHNQVFIGELRGGVYNGPTDQIDPAYLKSLQESNMRPEWYNLSWAQRYHFPPFFQTVNALAKGWIDPDTATHWLTVQGYDPDAIKLVIAGASGGSTGGKKLSDTAIKAALKAGSLTPAQALTRLEANGYSAADAQLILDGWNIAGDTAANEPH